MESEKTIRFVGISNKLENRIISRYRNRLTPLLTTEETEKLAIDSTYKHENVPLDYDKEKQREMVLDAAEIVLGYFGFDRTIYGNKKNTGTRKWQWLEELRQEREKISI